MTSSELLETSIHPHVALRAQSFEGRFSHAFSHFPSWRRSATQPWWSRAASQRCRRRPRSEEHTSELQSRGHLVCRLLLEKKNRNVCNNGIYIESNRYG